MLFSGPSLSVKPSVTSPLGNRYMDRAFSTTQRPIIDKKLYESANNFVYDLPLESLQHPIKLIELGSRMIRVIVIPGQQGPVHQPYFANYPSPLAESLEAHNGHVSFEARQKLIDTFKQIKWHLPEPVKIEEFKCIATSGLRDAQNSAQTIKALKERVGLADIEVLSHEREANLSYVGTLYNQRQALLQKNLVVDIGSGSIQLAMGTGNTHIEKGTSLAMPVGAQRIRLTNPFDPASVKMSQFYVSDRLNEYLTPTVIKKAQGRHAYIHGSRIFQVLKRVHEHYFQTPLLDKNNALSREKVDFYLSPKGLAVLEKAYKEDGTLYDDLIKFIPRNLIILSVLMDKLNLEEFRLGSVSCLRAAYCHELAEKQLKQTLAPVAEKLADVYKQALPRVVNDFKSIFQDFDQNFLARDKSAESILDKLVKYAYKKNSAINVHHLPDVINEVHDGVGVRTTQLPYTREDFIGLLKRLVTEKGYVPRRYTNYESQDGLNYLDKDILEKNFPPQPIPDEKLNRTREVVKRANNYMTTQIYFQPPGVKDYFVELQVRGPEVNSVAEAEHLFYSLQRRKSTGPKAILELETIMQPVASAVNSMTRQQLTAYEGYLAECYRVARRREKDEEAFYPPLPEGVSPLLEVNHLRMVKERLAAVEKRRQQEGKPVYPKDRPFLIRA